MKIEDDFQRLSHSMVVFVEEARRLSQERLLAEQAKAEVTTLRKHYSEADVNLIVNEKKTTFRLIFFFPSRPFIVYKVKIKYCRMKMKFFVKKPDK